MPGEGAVPKAVKDCFEAYDSDGDGKISKQELCEVLMELDPVLWTEETVTDFWERNCLDADLDGDGCLDLREFLLWVYSGSDEEKDKALEVGDDSEDDEAAAFQVLKLNRNLNVKVLEFDSKSTARAKFKRFRRKGRTAVVVKDGTICPGKVTGDLYRCVFLIGVAFGKGYSDMGPCAIEGSDYCVFPDQEDFGDQGDEEGAAGEGEEPWDLVFVTRDGSTVRHDYGLTGERGHNRFLRKTRKGQTAILCHGGEIMKFRGDGDEGGDFDERVHKELAFLAGASYGRSIISNLGPFGDGGAYPILGPDFEDSDAEA